MLEAALVNAAGSRRLRPDPPKVSQFREIRGFFKAYKRYLNGFTATEQEKKESLYLALQTGQDRVRVTSVENDVDDADIGYNALETTLLGIFSPPSESNLAKEEFKSRRQTAYESVQLYVSDKHSLFEVAYPDDGRDTNFFLRELILGLYHTGLKKAVLADFSSLTFDNYVNKVQDALVGQKLILENSLAEDNSPLGLYTSQGRAPLEARNPPGPEPMEVDSMQQAKNCFGCGKPGHIKRDCKQSQYSGGGNKFKPGSSKKPDAKKNHCFKCLAPGHFRKDCRVRPEKLEAARKRNAQRSRDPVGNSKSGPQRPRIVQVEQNEGADAEDEVIKMLETTGLNCLNPTRGKSAAGFHAGVL